MKAACRRGSGGGGAGGSGGAWLGPRSAAQNRERVQGLHPSPEEGEGQAKPSRGRREALTGDKPQSAHPVPISCYPAEAPSISHTCTCTSPPSGDLPQTLILPSPSLPWALTLYRPPPQTLPTSKPELQVLGRGWTQLPFLPTRPSPWVNPACPSHCREWGAQCSWGSGGPGRARVATPDSRWRGGGLSSTKAQGTSAGCAQSWGRGVQREPA